MRLAVRLNTTSIPDCGPDPPGWCAICPLIALLALIGLHVSVNTKTARLRHKGTAAFCSVGLPKHIDVKNLSFESEHRLSIQNVSRGFRSEPLADPVEMRLQRLPGCEHGCTEGLLERAGQRNSGDVEFISNLHLVGARSPKILEDYADDRSGVKNGMVGDGDRFDQYIGALSEKQCATCGVGTLLCGLSGDRGRGGGNTRSSEADAGNPALLLYCAQSLQADVRGHYREQGQRPIGQVGWGERFRQVFPPWALRAAVSLTSIGVAWWLGWRSGADGRLRKFWWTVLAYGLLLLGSYLLFPAARWFR